MAWHDDDDDGAFVQTTTMVGPTEKWLNFQFGRRSNIFVIGSNLLGVIFLSKLA